MDYILLHEQTWRKATRWMYLSAFASALAMVATVILYFVMTALLGSSLFQFGYITYSQMGLVYFLYALIIIMFLVVVAGYVVYMKSLWSLREEVHPHDKPMITILFAAMSFQPLILLMRGSGAQLSAIGVSSLIVSVMLFICFWTLMKSSTFPDMARQGAAWIVRGMIGVVAGTFVCMLIAVWSPMAAGLVMLCLIFSFIVLNVCAMRLFTQSEAPALPQV